MVFFWKTSSLFKQCTVYLAPFNWIVCKREGKLLYSCCSMMHCCQDFLLRWYSFPSIIWPTTHKMCWNILNPTKKGKTAFLFSQLKFFVFFFFSAKSELLLFIWVKKKNVLFALIVSLIILTESIGFCSAHPTFIYKLHRNKSFLSVSMVLFKRKRAKRVGHQTNWLFWMGCEPI